VVAKYLQAAHEVRGTVEGLVPNLYFGAPRYDASSDSVTQVLHVADRGRDYAIVCATPVGVLRQELRKYGAGDPLALYRQIVPLARQAFLGKFRRADWSQEHLPRLMLRLCSADIARAA
jgi:hypothetical protein